MPTTTVKVIAHSKSFEGPELISLELHYPRYIHAEMLRHGLHHGRSVSSSRAIPTKLLIDQVRNDPVIPPTFYKNKPGMSSWEPLDPEDQERARVIWTNSSIDAIKNIQELQDIECHKQHINRLLEPFIQVHELVTATSWVNFYDLRLDEAAHPEILELAAKIKAAIRKSTPKIINEGEWHLPYLDNYIKYLDPEEYRLVSVALCARLSYSTYSHEDRIKHSIDNLGPDKWVSEQLNLASKLLEKRHMTPFEHVARPIYRINGEVLWIDHLYGWQTFRNKLRGWKDKC